MKPGLAGARDEAHGQRRWRKMMRRRKHCGDSAWRAGASGQSAAAYGAEHGLLTSALWRWSARFKREDAARSGSDARAGASRVRLARVVRQPTPAVNPEGGSVVIDLPNARARVIVDASVARGTLHLVFEALGVRGIARFPTVWRYSSDWTRSICGGPRMAVGRGHRQARPKSA